MSIRPFSFMPFILASIVPIAILVLEMTNQYVKIENRKKPLTLKGVAIFNAFTL